MSPLEPLFELNHDPVAVLAHDGTIVRANAAWQDVLGHSPAALRGRPLIQLLPATDGPVVGEWLARPDAGPLRRTSSLRAASGELRPVHLVLARDPNTDGVCLIARADAGPDEAARRRRGDTEIERFASVAAHDLQEPLRKIQAFSDRLRLRYEALLPEPGRDFVQRMQSAARRMQGLIDDLLMFSRLSTRALQRAPVDLAASVREVLAGIEARIEETEARVEVGPLPTISADPAHMRLLLDNLIGNAIKFRRPESAPVVRISAQALPAGDGRPAAVRLAVRDNGIGIEARHHERVFGIFERLHGRGKYEGTGVGLAVCRKICELHGGTIHAESEPDGGTAIIVELVSESAADLAIDSATESATESAADLAPVTTPQDSLT